MKKILSSICLLLSFFIGKAQQTNNLSIKTDVFEKYKPTQQGFQKIQYRYDALNRMTLKFTSSSDDTLDVELFDYDPNGNLTEKNEFSLAKSKKKKDLYLMTGPFDKAKFIACKKKLLDRLEKKQ